MKELGVASSIDQMYPELGRAALSITDGLAGRLLVYAEVEEGVISADVFYVDQSGAVRFRFSGQPLQDLVYAFWKQWQTQPEHREWRAMAYVVDGGKFSIDLIYPDQIEGFDLAGRRPAVVRKYFGELKVDYSKPQ